MEGSIKMVILDVLKSQAPGVEEYAKEISEIEGVDAISITVVEVDSKTETLKVSIEGRSINLDEVRKTIKQLGGTVHSVDKVVASHKDLKDISFCEGLK